MTDEIRYCATGCTRNGHPTQTTPPAAVCTRCEDQLRGWTKTIPENHTLLPTFVEHGTTDRNPDTKSTKAAEAPAPMRLEIIDLLDTRLGRKWQGTATTNDRRGVLGTVLTIANEIADRRDMTPPQATVYAACDYITRHLTWLTTQEWAAEVHAELKSLNRNLQDAIGDYRPKPVGKCHVEDEATQRCGGPLMANRYGGVRCARCHATWDAAHLRQLGLAQAQEQETA